MNPAGIGPGGSLAVVGVGMALQNGLPLARANASRRWPTTMGRIRSAQVETYSAEAIKARYTGGTPAVCFEYTVDGKRFERTAFVGEGSKDFSAAQNMLKRYHAGQQISVRYDPSRPDRAIMEGEYASGSKELTFFGGILCAFGVVAVVSSL